ncbi:hypothetical protein BDN67DRAFT_1013930 [Paxillus ammoniavirescens]|nr:hypothetical protein BDN67DRAFT_1013930 [Paxillus ammoniavirescens]
MVCEPVCVPHTLIINHPQTRTPHDSRRRIVWVSILSEVELQVFLLTYEHDACAPMTFQLTIQPKRRSVTPEEEAEVEDDLYADTNLTERDGAARTKQSLKVLMELLKAKCSPEREALPAAKHQKPAPWRLTQRHLQKKRGKKPPTTIYSRDGSAISKPRRAHSTYQVHSNGSILYTRQFVAVAQQQPLASALCPPIQDCPPPTIPEPVDDFPPEVDLGIYDQSSRKHTTIRDHPLLMWIKDRELYLQKLL